MSNQLVFPNLPSFLSIPKSRELEMFVCVRDGSNPIPGVPVTVSLVSGSGVVASLS